MKNRMIIILAGLLFLLNCSVVYYSPYPAGAEYVYYGHHPIPSYVGGGMCYIHGRHIHSYPPENIDLFYYYEGTYFYIGTTISYFGPHPKPLHLGGGMCLIDGYHTHTYYPHSSGYVYYPDDNVFVYVDGDISVHGRRPYQPRNRGGAYPSGIPYSDESGRHQYIPRSQEGGSRGDSGSHGYSGGSSGGASGTGHPAIENPQRIETTYTPKKFEPSANQPVINPPSQTRRRIEPYQPQINTPADTKRRRIEFNEHPTINTPSETNKKFEPSTNQPVINPPSQTRRRVEPYQPQINTPADTKRRTDFNKGPKRYDLPSQNRFTPQDGSKKKGPAKSNFPHIDTKKEKGTTTEEDEEANNIKNIKKVYRKDEVKIPGVNKKIPGPDPVSK